MNETFSFLVKNPFGAKIKIPTKRGGKRVLNNFCKYSREALPSDTAMAGQETAYTRCFLKSIHLNFPVLTSFTAELAETRGRREERLL